MINNDYRPFTLNNVSPKLLSRWMNKLHAHEIKRQFPVNSKSTLYTKTIFRNNKTTFRCIDVVFLFKSDEERHDQRYTVPYKQHQGKYQTRGGNTYVTLKYIFC